MEMNDIVNQLTGGRPYCFVLMPYKSTALFYNHIRRLIVEEACMACIRADEIPGAGYDLLDKVHLLIARAAVVLAEISLPNPNVFYEVGYAVGLGKQVLVIAKQGAEIPADLRGLEVLHFDETSTDMNPFDRSFLAHVSAQATSRLPLLRDMLIPPQPHLSYIVCSPKMPNPESKHPLERRTYGDYLGVLGIVNAFGAVLGEGNSPELVSSHHTSTEIFSADANLYLIGAGKVNNFTDEFLEKTQRGRAPNWSLPPALGEERRGDWKGVLMGERPAWPPRDDPVPAGRNADYGVIVRAPHPLHPQRMVMVMAGAHSLGTGAACLAATRSQIIAKIQARMPPGAHLGHKEQAIWVLVRGVSSKDRHIDAEDVEVIDAGVYQ